MIIIRTSNDYRIWIVPIQKGFATIERLFSRMTRSETLNSCAVYE